MDARRIGELMEELGRAATEAAAVLALAPGAQKNAALVAAAQTVRARRPGSWPPTSAMSPRRGPGT
jgi:hypothetical protein